ncbi:endonuclease/exonuclease/phosphatase family protein [Agreia sp. VKM Ac-1783]|uniref:endonuclease/exonuclease/phosphatase family protein n=1 Tax=Agreia sp. VKM Ac-1783 TaxID=1938889 RepID=UPI000A2ABB38|nr:endonuclease/exonuclease/phosphatase family protein [Agreia sp. VKM Ac-1783]SMQ71921.1 exodeoxyribonuclease-3 [Agreia sp. VKM Ac-1783]
MLSILTLNIGAASLKRAELLCDWLSKRPEDVIVLTETSAGEGSAFLFRQFERAGYAVVSSDVFNGDRGAALLSRVEIDVSLVDALSDISIPVRAAGAVLRCEPGVTLLGLYVPSRDASPAKIQKKRLFIEEIVERLQRLSATSIATTVVGGDYNVIHQAHVPRYPSFMPFEYEFLSSLETLGLRDAQQIISPNTQVHSWVGRTGDGYKYDYFHVGPYLHDGVQAVEYIDETRILGLTDHSAVSISLQGIEPVIREVREVGQADQEELGLLF